MSMKKILHKLRVWLLRLLGGVPNEWRDAAFDLAVEKCAKQKEDIEAYQKTVRELCRRTGTLYYNWCCEYCATPCDKRDGWCFCFEPSHDL